MPGGEGPSPVADRRSRAGWTSLLCLAAALIPGSRAPAFAQDGEPTPGVSPDRVLFGQSAALSGPAAALGQGMRLGIQAAFAEINRRGGVHGRTLELVSLDDGYEPEAALANTRRLLQEENVFALIGPVGTPTSRAAEPVVAQAGAPYIGPFTGAEFLREPDEAPTAVNIRASYFQETDEMVERLIEDLGVSRIAVLYQDDSYGNAGLTGVRMALSSRRRELSGLAAYQRNTTAVKVAVLELRRADPEAVIIIGAYRPVAEFVRWARRIDFNPILMNISFVGSEALAADLGAAGEGVLITQVVPFPEDNSLRVVRNYRDALRRQERGAPPSFVSLEGYIAGRLAGEVLERAGPELTRAGFLETLTTIRNLDFGGFSLTYGRGDTQGSDRVFLTRIEANGSLRPLTSLR
ncbi:MAG: ABC transporter substrate-binding protein [Acidobacteria bacterium]|nr:ABC transporter substrate-binding protein [Acidobacteriota bacterium]MYK80513.1 ABC transporter substrate-binding protein [Acidobacteriota bacterium]